MTENGNRGYLAFVWTPSGYALVEQAGEPPHPGTEVEDEHRRYRVAKVAPSPLPGDTRRCAYLLPT